MQTPCYQCKKRCAGCHAVCGEYRAWKEQREIFLARMNAQKAKEVDMWLYQRGLRLGR